MDLGIQGKWALVTGGSSGIGFSIAEVLLAEGASVVVASRSADKIERAIGELRKKQPSGKVEGVVVDLSDETSIRSLFERTQKIGTMDIVINNTGGPATGTALNLSIEDWDRGYRSLVRSIIQVCKLYVPAMQAKKWGRILNITSTAAVELIPNLPISGTFRAGLSALTKTLAKDLGPSNILINNLLPGPTRTDRLKELEIHSPEFFKSMGERSALGRIAEPEEPARVAAFLCSAANGFMTGTDCLVDGASTSVV